MLRLLIAAATTANSTAASGNNVAARFISDCSIVRPTKVWFATGKFKAGGSGRFLHASPRMHSVQARTCSSTPATTGERASGSDSTAPRVLFAWLITFP